MTFQSLWMLVLAAGMLPGVVSDPHADEIGTDKADFERGGWQLRPVQRAMNDYRRDHCIRVYWLHEPHPPDAVTKEYQRHCLGLKLPSRFVLMV